jgi:hypothetical protein
MSGVHHTLEYHTLGIYKKLAAGSNLGVVIGIPLQWVAGVLSEAGTAYPSRAPGFTPGFWRGSVLLIYLAFCVVLCFCVLFVFVLCLLCPMLSMSLDCPCLITRSVFSGVYFRSYQFSPYTVFILSSKWCIVYKLVLVLNNCYYTTHVKEQSIRLKHVKIQHINVGYVFKLHKYRENGILLWI